MLNSNFLTALTGAAFGAFAGAWGAQRIAERAKYRDELRKEINFTNVANSLVYTICNTLIGLKKQNVKELKETFDADKVAYLEYLKKINTGELGKETVPNIQANLRTFTLFQTPEDSLQKQIQEKLSLSGRPLILTTMLAQSIHTLNVSLEKRNKFVQMLADRPPVKPHEYFGLLHNGHLNEEYPSLVETIYKHTDDGIYIGRLLSQELVKHGEAIAARYNSKFRDGAPRVSRSNFTEAEQAGLMPSADQYEWTMKIKGRQEPEDVSKSLIARWAKSFRTYIAKKFSPS